MMDSIDTLKKQRDTNQKTPSSTNSWMEHITFRLATKHDIAKCYEIESASYPPDEAASLTSLTYRQQHATPFFLCAMLQNNNNDDDDDNEEKEETIVGFTCATKCRTFTEESMSTHDPNGTLLAIHSVVVEESYRRCGLASKMLQYYISAVKKQRTIERIVLLAKSHLLGFYVNCGFQVMRPSSISHGKDLWYDLEINLALSNEALPSSASTQDYYSGNINGGDDAANIIRSPFLSLHSPKKKKQQEKIALVILNTPMSSPPSSIFTHLWNMASFHVCADGGANRLYDATITKDNEDNKYIPELIRGDLDSLRSNVESFYKSKGCKVERDSDQDTNDLDKALQVILKKYSSHENNKEEEMSVYIYGAFGGRFDQEMASIQALYKWQTHFHNKIFLYNDETCAFILAQSIRNEIRLPFYGDDHDNHNEQDVDDKGKDKGLVHGEGPTCGLIPIGCKCDFVQTTGLKWNLHGDVPLEFGGLVSTSNHASEECITVICSEPLIFTAEISTRRI
uniref:N-acetyltransferase domain-containing protein n=1 Tax=Ditylum brightwellii TaxID=49249 RepID=A0A7S1ZSZ4_9STRA